MLLPDLQYKIIERKKDNAWQVIIKYKHPVTEKWKSVAKQGFTTKPMAQRYADVLLNELKKKLHNEIYTSGEPVANMKEVTLEEFTKIYVTTDLADLSVGTHRTYYNAVTKCPNLLKVMMKDINHADLQKAIKNMQPTYKPSTINLAIDKLHVLFRGAMKYKIIYADPMTDIKHIKDRRKSVVKALTIDELKLLLEFMKNSSEYYYYVICAFAGYAGLRWGEIVGLTWDRINNYHRSLTIDRQWGEVQDGIYGFKPPKSDNGYRTVPYAKSLQDIINEYREVWEENDSGRLFIYYDASSGLNHEIKKVFPDKSIHKLRHTYATYLTSTHKFEIQEIAALMGDSVETVMKTYFHVTDDIRKAAKKNIDTIFDF